MDKLSNLETAIELLQQLGLKEYEARSFVALSRLPHGTAKEISDVSEVPRTRVYDAVRVLETKGLVEIQHSNPQVFRAVSVGEAADTLRAEYDSRAERLRETLEHLEPASTEAEGDDVQEVWSLTGSAAISTRTKSLIDEADWEVVLVLGHEAAVDEELLGSLRDVSGRGVTPAVGTVDESLREVVESELSDAEVFVSGLDWLAGASFDDDQTVISRLMLIDRSAILVSSLDADETDHEQAVFGRGFDNGFVTMVRRLLASGLLPNADPKPEHT